MDTADFDCAGIGGKVGWSKPKGQRYSMRILHVLPRLDGKAGGPTTVALGLTAALNELPNISAEIVTLRDREHDDLPLPSTQQATRFEGVPVWFLPGPRYKLRSFAPSMELVKWAQRHIGDYDVIHLHYVFSFTTLVLGALAVRHRKPFIIRPLGQLSPWSLSQRRIVKALWSCAIDRPLMRRAAFIHVTSDQEAADVAASGVATRAVVLPPGVALPELPPVARSASMILFLGRIHPKKRPELLLPVLERLVRDGFDATLVFAGTGDEECVARLRRLASDSALEGRVTFAGFLGGVEKWKVLKQAAVFVLPSHAENFGVAAAEAVACGCPVVLTREVDIAGQLEAAGAALIAAPTSDALAAAVATILSDSALARKMSAAGANFAAEHWSWPTIAHRLAAEYQRAYS